MFASFSRIKCTVSTQGVYQNDHQPSLIRIVVLKVKDIASRKTKGRVYTDDLENTSGNAFLQAYYIVKIPYSWDSTYTICSTLIRSASLEQ